MITISWQDVYLLGGTILLIFSVGLVGYSVAMYSMSRNRR